MRTLGLRHVAIQVADPQKSKEWYMRVLKMDLEWEPDAENVYLTSGGHDNLAIHKGAGSSRTESAESTQLLDHLGFALPTMEDVDEWYKWVQSQNVKILREIKTHRDGARSFYMQDLNGIAIQMIYHPPIAARAQK
jgi:catechol 2,3-dioxygenase-like lactoylglutathione lyase family enzyme